MNMAKVIEEVLFGEHTLRLETGEVARQADGAVLVSMGGTQVLVTAVFKKLCPNMPDFFPLTVNYQEKTFAVGKIPGGYNKREGRPSEHETLVSRLIDRPLRPSFPKGFRHDVQVVATVLSLNPEVSADILAMIGASAALAVSGIPYAAPIAAARVGYAEGMYVLNPSAKALVNSQLDMVVAGNASAILMVESEAKELSESIMLGAVLFGHTMMQSVIHAIEALKKSVGKPAFVWEAPVVDAALTEQVKNLSTQGITDAYTIKEKTERYARIDAVKQSVVAAIQAEKAECAASAIEAELEKVERQLVRERILNGEARIDGRDKFTVRPIAIRPSFLERAHGSALFTRGETQAIVAATLGNERDAQLQETLLGPVKDRFMLHYNFPPYSVGETGMMGSPKRREIGHGRLARRSLMAVLPSLTDFPYVLRVVSEITESNGSSSMATVCGASLALMDAGVPIKAPVAGIAMGLIKDGARFAVLTDILGDEDHLGDMDFKVAGTADGVTALQMDIKIDGIDKVIMTEALDQALKARMHILGIMNQVLPAARTEMSPYAPRIMSFRVAEDKIRNIIGKGGATIKGLTESTGVTIDIDDTGLVQLFSPDANALEEAQKQIKGLIGEVEVGHEYTGKVTKIVEYGAFVNIMPGRDGLLHISQICSDRNQKVETHLSEGQTLTVLLAGVDKLGRMKLEWVDRPTPLASETAAPEAAAEKAPEAAAPVQETVAKEESITEDASSEE
ncbi:MAG: polyribonucleotide nucleotidyltransferase [Legionellaceae bacterium]|nr:polyribonucleotide nucleotidyltransferase [Legionellaceae bacterium]